MGREATRAVSGGRPSVAEALRAHASVICLQHHSLPPHSATEQVSLKKKCPPPSPLCQGVNQTLKRPANKRSYNRGKRLGSITTNKASGGDGIPAELFQILKDDAVKVLYSICQQI